MIKTSINLSIPVLLAAAAILASGPAFSQQIFRWIDDSGQENFTDDLNNVPAKYRSRVKTEGKPAKSKPAAEAPAEDEPPALPPPPQPAYRPWAPENPEGQAGSGRINKLNDDLKELNAALERKTAELNNAFLWESMVHSPQYTQKKIAAQKEIDEIKAKIRATRAEIDRQSASKAGRE